jgi:hypothetical protein
VRDSHRKELTKLADSAVPLLIPAEWAKIVRVKSNRTIVIQDKLCGDEPFTYTARIVTKHGAEMLRPDLEVLAYFNPIAPEKLCLCDMNGSYIGTLNATNRIAFTDHETMLERLGERSAIKADLEAPVRAAMASTMQDRMEMKAHNDRLIEQGTPEEQALSRIAKADARAQTRYEKTLAEETASALSRITIEE